MPLMDWKGSLQCDLQRHACKTLDCPYSVLGTCDIAGRHCSHQDVQAAIRLKRCMVCKVGCQAVEQLQGLLRHCCASRSGCDSWLSNLFPCNRPSKAHMTDTMQSPGRPGSHLPGALLATYTAKLYSSSRAFFAIAVVLGSLKELLLLGSAFIVSAIAQ